MLTSRTIPQFRQAMLDAWTVYRPNDSVEEGSDAWCVCNAVAIQLYRDQQRDLEIGTWISPLTAVGEQLDAHGERWLPVSARRKAATKWSDHVLLTATAGTPAFAAGKVGTAGNGQSYITTQPVVAGDWSGPGGTVSVLADAVVAGTAANQGNGTTLTLSSPPAGVSPNALLVVGASVVLGTDRESDSDYRIRVVGASVGRPGAGNAAHWIEWAESVPGVGKAFVYKRFYGLTTVFIGLLGAAGSRLTVPAAVQTAVDAAILAARPTGHTPVRTPIQAIPVSVAAAISPKAGYGPDWTGTLTEDVAFASTTTTVYTDAAPFATVGLVHGMRVVCTVTGTGASEERIVDVVDDPGKNFTVTVPFSAAPVNGSIVYPGGPLWQPCYDATAAVFDSLGPARETTGNAPRDPATSTSWPSKLFVSDIYHAIESQTGVLGCGVTAPAADQEATCAQYDATISKLTLDPGVILTFV